MIKVLDNFCEEDILTDLFQFVIDCNNKNVWSNSLLWNKDIVEDSNIVQILFLSNELPFIKKLINKYQSLGLDIGSSSFGFNFYIWPKLSYIPFHNDGNQKMASTIYLNKSWKKDFGGLFLYEENNEIKAIVPEYNKCIINTNKVMHGTSMTTFNAPQRLSLQMFVKNEN